MTQTQLDYAVARATGESLTIIRQMGFEIADPDIVRHDPEPIGRRPRIVNWDAVNARRVAFLPQRSRTGRRRTV